MKSAFFRIQITQIALSDILKNAPISQRQHSSESSQIHFSQPYPTIRLSITPDDMSSVPALVYDNLIFVRIFNFSIFKNDHGFRILQKDTNLIIFFVLFSDKYYT